MMDNLYLVKQIKYHINNQVKACFNSEKTGQNGQTQYKKGGLFDITTFITTNPIGQ